MSATRHYLGVLTGTAVAARILIDSLIAQADAPDGWLASSQALVALREASTAIQEACDALLTDAEAAK